MERDKPSDLERVTEIMNSRYPSFSTEGDLRHYLRDGFDNFSFTPGVGITKYAVGEILNETLKLPHRVLHSNETTYAAVKTLSVELETNSRNVIAGFLPSSVEDDQTSQYTIRTKKPIQVKVGRTMPNLWLLDGLSGLEKKDVVSYRKNVSKRLHEAIMSYGIGFGILAGSYIGMSSDDIINLFRAENFKSKLERKGWKKIPSESREGDRSAISEIRVNLDEGTEKGYKDSLQLLNDRGWLPTNDRIREVHYGIQQISEKTTPCVHLMSAGEAAINSGAEIFKPYDLGKIKVHIQRKYQSDVTSEVVSAHMASDRQYPKW